MGQESFTAQKRTGVLGLSFGFPTTTTAATTTTTTSSAMANGARPRFGGRAQIQKTFNNIKITILCGFVTILVLRGTIGVGTLGGGGGSNSYSDALRIVEENDRILAEIRSDDPEEEQVPLDPVSELATYSLGPKIADWDRDRREWLESNPEFSNHLPNGKPRMLLVTGSPPKPCDNPIGDHYLLKVVKNKIDYCRIHGIEIVYNLAHLDRELSGYWAKLPLIRRLMVSHPEVEWIWWMDSDALFTDMSFEIPVKKYDGFNLVVHGYPELMFEKRSWVALNTGSFLIRNCRWSLELLDAWAPMGPKGRIREEAGRVLTRNLNGRPDFEADDQSALIYLLLSQKEKWMERVFMENSYYLHGYWAGLVERLDGSDRPFVTHFVGCKPCGSYGDYPVELCLSGMERAFNFADDQILELYGYKHRGLLSPKVKRIRNESLNPIEVVDKFDIRRNKRS